MTCGKYYELADGEVVFDCDRERGHEPPHRGARDYRIDGGGSLVTAEWWDHWGEEAGERWD